MSPDLTPGACPHDYRLPFLRVWTALFCEKIIGIKGRFFDPLVSLALLIVAVFLLIIVRVIDTFHEYFSVIYLIC